MIILDVTKIESRLKHPTIFARFDDLDGGDVLVIHNDHDPKPLYYQMLAERGKTFEWEYLEQGPEWWKVKITKLHPENSKSLEELSREELIKAAAFGNMKEGPGCGK
jgi:regulator of cell morphogenesis and NO signaling